MGVRDSVYWENRIAKNTWRAYNSQEERNRHLLEMYQDATRSISEELYKTAEKINSSGGITLSDMHKFNRLGSLRKNFEKIIEDLGSKAESFAREGMQSGFKEVYGSTSSAISNTAFTSPNKKLMDEMLDRPWQGSSFSKRLWKNTSVLAINLNDNLVAGLQQGKTIAEISINLANTMQQGFNVAHRLVRTETMHYLNNSALRAYQDKGITHVQIWTAEDERTCKHCMKYHEKVYAIDKAPILPIHAHCRCTYLPVVDYNEKSDIIKDKEMPTASSIPDAQHWAERNLGFSNVNYKGVDIEVANQVNNAVAEIYKEYPLLKGFVKELKTDGRLQATASANLSYKDGKLNVALKLSKDDLKDLPAIDKMIDTYVESKWWSPKNGAEGIIKHEIGHMIEYAIVLRKWGVIDLQGNLIDSSKLAQAFDDIRSGSFSNKILLEAISNLRIAKTKRNTKDYLSDYANTNSKEFLAEAVSEHNPRVLAKETVKLLKEAIKEVWK